MKIQDLGDFHRKHMGEKIFLVGSGPSLTYEVMDSLVGQTTMAMNNIGVAFPHTEWRPTYYLNVSRSFRGDEHWQDVGMKAIDSAEHSFIWVRNAIVPMSRGTDASITLLSCSTIPIWPNDKLATISRWGTSMFSAFQLAEFMGFGHIFLIGCDLGYYSNFDAANYTDNTHFSDGYLGEAHLARKTAYSAEHGLGYRLLRDEIRTFIAHEIAAVRLRDRGAYITICNEGPLRNIYEYMPIEDAIAYTPRYYRPQKRTK